MSRVSAAAAVVAALCLSCSDRDIAGVQPSAARVYAVQNNELIEYSAPPLAEARRMSLVLPAGVMRIHLIDDEGGFLGEIRPHPGTGPITIGHFRVVRYDGTWTERVNRQLSDYIGQDTVVPEGWRFTPDGRFMVAEVPLRSVAGRGRELLAVHGQTLNIVRQIPTGTQFGYLGYGPSAATGTQIQVQKGNGGCGTSVMWINVESGVTEDSTAIQCGVALYGAQTTRRLYIHPSYPELPRLTLWNADAAAELAHNDTLPATYLLADPARNQLVGIDNGDVIIYDAATLRALHRIDVPGRWVSVGQVDASGLFAGTTFAPCQLCDPLVNGVVLIDLVRGALIADDARAFEVALPGRR